MRRVQVRSAASARRISVVGGVGGEDGLEAQGTDPTTAPRPGRRRGARPRVGAMATTRAVALLRGINVGGKNPVRMADLRAALEAARYGDVRTYIQSGNVLFTTDEPAAGLEDRVEAVLEERFGIPIVVVIRTERQFR